MTSLISVAISVRQRAENPWLTRCLAALQAVPCGLPDVPVRVEEGPQLTKVEKKLRLLRGCGSKDLCLLEDDAEPLTAGWLASLLLALQSVPGAAVAGPLEAGPSATREDAEAACRPEAQGSLALGGFCQLIDAGAGLAWDVRVQAMDDLWLSLQARSRGFALLSSHNAVVRHTKEPWARDATPPWQQGDRSRFGEGDAYYARDRHEAQRLREARLLVETFGDLARAALPIELMAVLEPGGPREDALRPGCSGCRALIAGGEDYVMAADGPRHFGCYAAPAREGEDGALVGAKGVRDGD